jgi:hypothetical protein
MVLQAGSFTVLVITCSRYDIADTPG